MENTGLTRADAVNIQHLLEYINRNGVIHKESLPEELGFITPEQYRAYKRVIFEIAPSVVENNIHSGNMGLPATDYLKDYMDKGGFLHFFDRQIAQKESETNHQLLNRALRQLEHRQQDTNTGNTAITMGKAANKKASIALVLSAVALIISIISILLR